MSDQSGSIPDNPSSPKAPEESSVSGAFLILCFVLTALVCVGIVFDSGDGWTNIAGLIATSCFAFVAWQANSVLLYIRNLRGLLGNIDIRKKKEDLNWFDEQTIEKIEECQESIFSWDWQEILALFIGFTATAATYVIPLVRLP